MDQQSVNLEHTPYLAAVTCLAEKVCVGMRTGI